MPKKNNKSNKNQLVVQVKPVAKSAPKARSRSNRPTQMKFSSVRPLSGTPKLGFRAGSEPGSLIVHGMEVFASVSTSSTWKSSSYVINPSNILMFPKLQGLATNFEEFYVRSLSVKYITAAPTTRSGSVTMMIDYDPSDGAPKGVLEAMANTTSTTGSTGENMTMTFDPRAQGRRWYYTRAPQLATYSNEDIRQLSPGAIHVGTTNAVSADVGLNAGYLQVLYEMEFKSMRPPPEVFGSFSSSDVGYEQPATTSTLLDFIIQNGLGINNWTGDSNIKPVPGSSTITTANSFALSAGRYLLSALWDWLAVGASVNRATDSLSVPCDTDRSAYLEVEQITPRPDERVEEKKEKKEGPKTFIPLLPIPKLTRQTAHSGNTGGIQYSKIKQQQDGSFIGLPFGSTVWEDVPPGAYNPGLDLVAGDVVLTVNAYDAESGAVTSLIGTTVSTGTGAVHLDRSLEVILLKPAVITSSFYNAEARKLNVFDLSFSQISGPE